jgi:hypothetical protein
MCRLRCSLGTSLFSDVHGLRLQLKDGQHLLLKSNVLWGPSTDSQGLSIMSRGLTRPQGDNGDTNTSMMTPRRTRRKASFKSLVSRSQNEECDQEAAGNSQLWVHLSGLAHTPRPALSDGQWHTSFALGPQVG